MPLHATGPSSLFDGIVKGNEINPNPNSTTGAKAVRGMYLSADGDTVGDEATLGRHGLRIGDGFHNYILASFVSCLTNGIPRSAVLTGAVLTLHTSRVFGENPFVLGGCCEAKIQVDMVRLIIIRCPRLIRGGGHCNECGSRT